MIGKLANYEGGTIPNTEQENVEDDVSQKGEKKKSKLVSVFKENFIRIGSFKLTVGLEN